MSTALANISRLKPEIRLAQAVSEFEADLSNEQKTAFRTLKSQSLNSPPDPSDVMRLTAEIDRRMSGKFGGRCFGPRFTNFLQGVQQFAAIGDVVVGGSQNMIACGVWSLVRMSLLAAVNLSSYVERFSTLFMDIGRSTPRYQTMAILYPRSKTLQSYLSEYFVVVVHLCHQLLKFTQKSTFRQIASTLSDSEIKAFQSKLDLWANSIKEEMSLLLAKRIEEEAQMNSQFRALTSKYSKSVSYQQRLATNLRVLDFCSKYDHETSWKQTRKIGNAALFRQIAEYQEWKDCSGSYTLLLTGKLGSGKSVLLANIVDDIFIHNGNKKTAVAYFFCRHDIPESLKARTVLGSLARQLLRTIPDLAMVAEVCDETSSTEDTEKIFKILQCALPPGYEACFILDGLDECDNPERELLAQELQRLQETLKLLLCISFRVEPNNGLESIAEGFTALRVISVPDDNPDIEAFIEAELERCLERQKLVIGDPTLILDIQDALLQRSQGMFLWVALQIQSLCSMGTDQAIRDALLDLPKDLSETFSRILRKSEGLGQSYQTQILQLITSAYRPLTTDELREALSVVPGDTVWTPSRFLNDVYSALACCGCLLTVDEEELTVRFVHHSVKQFLLDGFNDSNNTTFTAKQAQRTMADIIATYLNYGVFGTELSTTKVPQVVIPSPQSSIIRATTGSSNTIQNLALKMLKSRKRCDFDISKTLAEARKSFPSRLGKEFCFYTYAKLYWLNHIICLSEPTLIIDGLLSRILEGKTAGMSASNEDYRSLLWWAAQAGHEETVRLIIERGEIDKDELQLLYLRAMDNGRNAIAKLLVDNGADVNAQGEEYGNSLQAASTYGHKQVVKLLLDGGVDVNAQCGYFGYALQAASTYGHEQVVKLLLDKGANVNEQGGKYGNALQAASCTGYEQVVKLLLNKGANVNAQGGYFGNALQAASCKGCEQVVKLLLVKGANINAQGGEHSNALQAASTYGHEQVVKLLLDKGANVNAQGGEYGNALQAALTYGHEQVVKLLLDKGADVNAQGGKYGNALQAASFNNREQVVKLLLDKGADVNTQGGYFGNALQAASFNSREQVVTLLLDKGANVNVQGGEYGNALQAALTYGHEQVVKLLLDKGADVNAQGGKYGNALQAASFNSCEQVVKLLLDKGADVNAQGGKYGNALQAASFNSREHVVELLLNKGASRCKIVRPELAN